MTSRKMDYILVVDDDIELCGLVQEYLTSEGFKSEAVHDGEIGLQRGLSGDYALVVLDVMLPGINGFEVLRRIRALFKERTLVKSLTNINETIGEMLSMLSDELRSRRLIWGVSVMC